MRGPQTLQGGIFSYVSLESRIPEDHPLRAIRRLVDAALEQLSRRFDGIYAKGVGRPSIPPEQLLRALLLQVLYTIRSERGRPPHGRVLSLAQPLPPEIEIRDRDR